MRPLINLRQFLAILVLVIVPAVLLTAYFRNYQAEGGSGHAHGGGGEKMEGMAMPAAEKESGGHEHGAMKSPASEPMAAGEMDHTKMSGMTPAPADPHAQMPAATSGPDAAATEAARAQLAASRAQLEASRKALEAAQPAPVASAPPMQSASPEADDHEH